MMKKIITLMMAFAIAIPTFAQFDGRRKTRNRFSHSNVEQYYGLRLGYNLASINSSNVNVDLKSYGGFAFGAVYGLQLANSTPLWMEAGLFYSEKGGKDDSMLTKVVNGTVSNGPSASGITATELTQKVTTRLMYLQIPIVIKYDFDVADDIYIQPFLGGYLGFGIGGKTKYYTSRESYDSFDDFNRLDAGLRFGCGAEFQMIYAELGFDFGIANICDDDFVSARNQSLFFNIGVNF